MSESKKINAAKLSDESLDGVNGGMMMGNSRFNQAPTGGLIGDGARKMPYDTNQKVNLRTAEMNKDTMGGQVYLMNDGIRSTSQKTYKNDPRNNITNA